VVVATGGCSPSFALAARCVLESKSASLRAAAGVPLASHTPCLGALVTIPPRLMQSYHCLEICTCLLAEGERQAADAAARDELVHFPKHRTPKWDGQLAPLTICPKSMAVAPARPALRTGPSITTMIKQESKCLTVCGVPVFRRRRGRIPGLRGFVRLSPFLVSIKGRCRLYAIIPEGAAT
jgi:hypothetical protein